MRRRCSRTKAQNTGSARSVGHPLRCELTLFFRVHATLADGAAVVLWWYVTSLPFAHTQPALPLNTPFSEAVFGRSVHRHPKLALSVRYTIDSTIVSRSSPPRSSSFSCQPTVLAARRHCSPHLSQSGWKSCAFTSAPSLLKTHPPPNDPLTPPPGASKALAAMLYLYVCFYSIG